MQLHFRILTALIVVFLLSVTLFTYRQGVANLLLPWLEFSTSVIETKYDIHTFEVIKNKHELAFHLRLTSEHPVTLYGHSFPKMDVSATTLVTHLIIVLFIYLSFLLVTPIFKKLRLLWFIPISIFFLLLTIAIDIPIVLLGSIEGLILENLAPEKLDGDFLVMLERLMNNGGRMGLAIGFSCLTLAITQKH